MSAALPLHFLAAGQFGTVDEVLGDVSQAQRLREIGVQPGSQVQMLRPGQPCVVRLRGNKVCFRGSEAIRVLVQPIVAEG